MEYTENGFVALDFDNRVEKDSPAIVRLKREAEQGDAEASLVLGDRYYRGMGVEKNSEKATKWYRKAAELGDHTAVLMLNMISKNFSQI